MSPHCCLVKLKNLTPADDQITVSFLSKLANGHEWICSETCPLEHLRSSKGFSPWSLTSGTFPYIPL